MSAGFSGTIIIIITAYDPLEIHLLLYYVCYHVVSHLFKCLFLSQKNVINVAKVIAVGMATDFIYVDH